LLGRAIRQRSDLGVRRANAERFRCADCGHEEEHPEKTVEGNGNMHSTCA
jgi:hypothetical protein